MGWSEDVERKRLEREGDASGAEKVSEAQVNANSGAIFAAAAIAVGVTAVWRHAGQDIVKAVGGFWKTHVRKLLPKKLRGRGKKAGRANRHLPKDPRSAAAAAAQARAAQQANYNPKKGKVNPKKDKKGKEAKQVKKAIKREAAKDKAAGGDLNDHNRKAKEVEEMTEEEKTFTTVSRWSMPEKFAKMGKNS